MNPNSQLLSSRSKKFFGVAATLACLISFSWSVRAAATAGGTSDSPATEKAPTAGALPNTKAFRKTAAEIDADMQSANSSVEQAPLSYKKGNGLRILMTGHSWVAPARITLPSIAIAAGYTDHVQRAHTSGGANGSPNAIWLNEHGQGKMKPYREILLPAIPTGQWDVMTWGMYTGDTVHDYTQWMEPCLKANPAMVFYIQDGWPTPRFGAKDLTGTKMGAMLGGMYRDTMIPMFKTNFDALNETYPGKVHIIPAGAAVVEMIDHFFAGDLPGFDCLAEVNGGKRGIYSPDSFHLSRESGIGYLLGYCYYSELYQRSPESIPNFHPKGVDPKVDQIMRQVAWHAITHSPFSGITDANGDGIADEIQRAGAVGTPTKSRAANENTVLPDNRK